MSANSIRKEDISDLDIVDAYELASDGYGPSSIYFSTTCVSTTTGTKVIVVNLGPDGVGIDSLDHPAQSGDIVWLSGTSGSAADGYFTINSVISNTSFSVNETIASSTGGSIQFRYPAGASKVGLNPTGLNNITGNTVSAAIKDIDAAFLTPASHEVVNQLIHFIDEGPADGFASGAVKSISPAGSIKPTSIVWYTDSSKTKKIVEQIIVWSGIVPNTITWKVYQVDGVTVAHTVSDSITYTNTIFELSRTRTIT